jgi:hypothetical protein
MPARETKRIVLFTLPPVRAIDLVGAADVFTSAVDRIFPQSGKLIFS